MQLFHKTDNSHYFEWTAWDFRRQKNWTDMKEMYTLSPHYSFNKILQLLNFTK